MPQTYAVLKIDKRDWSQWSQYGQRNGDNIKMYYKAVMFLRTKCDTLDLKKSLIQVYA